MESQEARECSTGPLARLHPGWGVQANACSVYISYNRPISDLTFVSVHYPSLDLTAFSIKRETESLLFSPLRPSHRRKLPDFSVLSNQHRYSQDGSRYGGPCSSE